ncbi:arylamine N-acetyltransferase [Halosegnis sp.]|uniref:arylamine N-acetyltransferase family protein n=1 Tax=Halosegnis sp. TaxID=2864959 RepID=UPI0035D407E7
MDPDAYLERLGLADRERPSDIKTLTRLVRAHALTVPFETLAVTGDPHGPHEGAGVSLDPANCYEKVVGRGRGGFCYELNGLFGWLLDTLGYDVDRVAAMVFDDDGDPSPPANHLSNVVALDRRYLVDVGTGGPRPRGPVPLDGTIRTERSGVAWRVDSSERPDSDYRLRYRVPGNEWTDRFVFTDHHRPRSYFTATCTYLTTAPESPFTGTPVVALSTPTGYRKLHPDRLVTVKRDDRSERAVTPAEWYDLLSSAFGLSYGPADAAGPNGT